ncbi:MAG: tetratricopeptide repeat protein [Sandaracinaceae bacterium]
MGAASQELTERAKLLISERRYQEAVRACRRALLSKPSDVGLRLLLGEALLALERYDEVRVEMMALARKAPLRGEVHRLLGEAYLRDRRPQQALESLRRAIELDPNDEVAADLIAEAADETAPISTTIERWFAEDVEPTVETSSPEWEEDRTPIPGPLPATPPSDTPPPPKVEIDPSLTYQAPPSAPRAAPPSAPAPRAAPPRPPGAPRVRPMRSRKSTSLGMPAASPFGDPAKPPRTLSSPATPHAAPPSKPGRSGPPPPPGRPKSAPPPPPPSPLSAASRPVSFTDEHTSAARPSALQRAPHPVTEEISIEDAEESFDPVSFEMDLKEEDPPREDMFPPFAEPSSPYDALPSDEGPTLEQIGADEVPEPETMGVFRSPGRMLEPAPPPPEPRFEPIADPAFRPEPAPARGHKGGQRALPTSRVPPDAGDPDRSSRSAQSKPQSPSKSKARSKSKSKGKKKSLLVPVMAGVLALVVVGGIGGLVLWMALGASEVAEIREHAAAAGDSGSRAALESLLTEIGDSDEPELVALRARTLATLTLEHHQDHADEVRTLLSQLDPSETHTDAAIAVALLAIQRGRPEEATRAIADMPARGESIAEGFRASALAMYQMGRWQRAAQMAEHAFNNRSASPRHLSLYALTQHGLRNPNALTILEGHAQHQTHAGLRTNLARILQESTSDPARAAVEANAVIEEMEGTATPAQLAWARLVRARRRAELGESEAALEDARAAAGNGPAWDPHFGVQVVEALMRGGAAQEADHQLQQLRPVPTELPLEAASRALLTARVALAVGDLDRAEQALGAAPDGVPKNLIRAGVLEARGRPAEARPLYESAIADPGPAGRRARVRLATMAMESDESARAVELLEPTLPAANDDLSVVPILARAYLQEDRASDSARVLEAALAAREGAPELLAARGALELYRGQHQAALASLRVAAEARPEDADLQADMGRAAAGAGETDAARTAFERALELRSGHPRALIGLALLAFASHDLEQAESRIDALAETGREGLEVARLRGRLFVTRGDGRTALTVMQPLAREHNDPAVWTALGDLQAQAEQDTDAGRSYDRALRAERGFPRALLGRSLVQIRRGSLRSARSAIVEATQQAARRGLEAELAPAIAVASGRVSFEEGSLETATTRANEAIQADEAYGPAHLLLANVAMEQSLSPAEALQASVAGHETPPEAVGRLAVQLARGEEACRLAARYLEIAPRGYDAEDVRDVEDRCP